MDRNLETIAKLRRIQIGIYVLHSGLLIGGVAYFVLTHETILAVITGLYFFYFASELLGRNSTVRVPIDKLGIQSIDYRNLLLPDWLMIGLLAILAVVEGIALIVYEPSHWGLSVWVPLLLTMALAPLVASGWMFDRSTREFLFTFVRSGFRFPPPGDEYWDVVRANHQEIKEGSLVSLVFGASITLQFLMLGIWVGSTAMLVQWSIVFTGVVKDVLLTRRVDLNPVPPSN